MDNQTVNWTGISGRVYVFKVFPFDEVLATHPGHYIFAKHDGAGWQALYIGQADNLARRLDDHEQEGCAKRRGATHIHARIAPADKKARLAEEEDLIRNYNPPCNTQHVTKEGSTLLGR